MYMMRVYIHQALSDLFNRGFKCAVLLSLPLFASAHTNMESIYLYSLSLKVDSGI